MTKLLLSLALAAFAWSGAAVADPCEGSDCKAKPEPMVPTTQTAKATKAAARTPLAAEPCEGSDCKLKPEPMVPTTQTAKGAVSAGGKTAPVMLACEPQPCNDAKPESPVGKPMMLACEPQPCSDAKPSPMVPTTKTAKGGNSGGGKTKPMMLACEVEPCGKAQPDPLVKSTQMACEGEACKAQPDSPVAKPIVLACDNPPCTGDVKPRPMVPTTQTAKGGMSTGG